MFFRLLIAVIAIVLSLGAYVESALTNTGKRIRTQTSILNLGSETSDYTMAPSTLNFTQGQRHRLKIIAHGFKNYTLVAPEFFASIELDTIKSEGVKIKVESIESLTLEEENEEVEVILTFIAKTPGTYPLTIAGLEERGMEAILTIGTP